MNKLITMKEADSAIEAAWEKATVRIRPDSPRDIVGDVLRDVANPESHAAFIPMPTNDLSVVTQVPVTAEQMVEISNADWHPVNDKGPQVTPEMLAAGRAAFSFHDKNIDAALIMAYRAMRELEFSATKIPAPDARAMEFLGEVLQALAEERIKAKNLLDQIASLTAEQDAVILRADNEIKEAISEANQLRSELADYKSAIRGGITHPPLSGDCHMIWWPDNQPIPSFDQSGETHQVIELGEAITALTAERDAAVRLINDDLTANASMKDEITTLTIERNNLHDLLAKFTAANAAETEPAKHDPFRDFPNDPRRMGR